MMKKTVSILLVLALLLSCFSFTAFAADDTSPPEYQPKPIEPTEPRTGFLYKDVFEAEVSKYDDISIVFYNELFYHQDENGDIDWVLVEVDDNYYDGAPTFYIVGNRVFSEFLTKHHNEVYDVKKNMIIDMSAFYGKPSGHSLDEYDGLEEAYNQYGHNDGRIGGLLGDMDKDNEITIADVTIMQRCLVGMWSFPQKDILAQIIPNETKIYYFSDFNCDGERDLVDATAIQRYLAELPFYRRSWDYWD